MKQIIQAIAVLFCVLTLFYLTQRLDFDAHSSGAARADVLGEATRGAGDGSRGIPAQAVAAESAMRTVVAGGAEESPDLSAVTVVRSSVGLPLKHVGLARAEDGTAWDYIEEGPVIEVALPLGGGMRKVKAAGHLEATVALGAKEIRLIPDVLLELNQSNAGATPWLDWAEFSGYPSRVNRYFSAGVISGKWVCALNLDQYIEDSRMPDDIFKLSLLLSSGWLARIEWSLPPAKRTTEYTIPAKFSSPRELGDLVGIIDGVWPPNTKSGALNWSLQPMDLDGMSLDDVYEDIHFDLPWGSIRLSNRTPGLENSSKYRQRGRHARFTDIIQGAWYGLVVWDDTLSVMGKIDVVASSSEEVKVQLHQIPWIEATLTDEATGEPLRNTQVFVQSYFDDKLCSRGFCGWSSRISTKSDFDGTARFAATNAQALQNLGGPQTSPPPVLRLGFYVAGAEAKEVDVTRADFLDGVYHLGEVAIPRAMPDLVIQLQSGQIADEKFDVLYWGEGGSSGAANVTGYMHFGSIELRVEFLKPGAEQMAPNLKRVAEAGKGIVLLGRDAYVLGAVSYGENDWQEVAGRWYGFDVSVPRVRTAGERVMVGIRWNGSDVPLGPARIGEKEPWRFFAPETGVLLWYEVLGPQDEVISRGEVILDELTDLIVVD